jgi:hypothetical protein
MLIGLVYYIRLTQKQTYTRKVDPSLNVSILPLMEEIADLFKTKVTDIVRDKSYYVEKAFGIRTDTLESRVEHLRAKLHLTMEYPGPAGAPSLLGPNKA